MEQTPKMTLAGKILSGLLVAFMALSAFGKLSAQPPVVEMFVQKLGFAAEKLPVIAALELACAIVFAVPQTALVGAILISCYFGGAVASHVRISDPFVGPVVFGALPWVALMLREPRLRALLPFLR